MLSEVNEMPRMEAPSAHNDMPIEHLPMTHPLRLKYEAERHQAKMILRELMRKESSERKEKEKLDYI